MKEYKMRRGETLEERIPDMEATVEDYFGSITGTEEYKGSELYVIDEPENPVFKRVVAGAVEYSGKKDKLAVNFEEADPADLAPEDLEAAGEAVSAKNDFLLEATGRDAKSRRNSMKRAVEDDSPDF
ncbi:hypothetical protein E6P09_04915 [Haloferax mediterranei ATCC 33500]|uniref:DUF5611 domain-containing protein n=1 Tax=Haloferax mediterranei (strain ATCC 33500 / DSM 1411 / JCM 8866 / NBRC 14739 / NCIMB 2177 / R-4) TaxID=523841 RepID=I3R1J4_HALMT|nr:DUF5611 family protein [Haloferax mediterranei]AFK18104.1 hypothetical protein HFX_0368 [Haloferax mediterranei ATCC 33500]AHZ22488.1 hypothetical protein BM92_07420 [Haloferax mediterranei ATCC 33500]EMA02623.1 hypothetical protein C439_08570 [Haloferax mediterranei ATCC 33500]MDX5988194.1 DUF5611 family protein [Haloferax mediterranei ATCC 33500]QCQ74638.1 hypothetical protein E6P09_04915 [Haloferax mediterranei ATCC 33500]